MAKLHVKLSLISVMQLLALLGGCIEARAADIWPYITGAGSYREVVIEGSVEPGDFDTFIRIVRQNQGRISTVRIFSPGGDFYEAMKIGRAMRALELGSMVPMRDPSGRPVCGEIVFGPNPRNPQNCTSASAAFFMHIAGVHRGGTFLAVHRPYIDPEQFRKLSQDQARAAFNDLQNTARSYMEEMGVPKHVQEEVLGTPSDRTILLDERVIKTYFWLELPYRHEWVQSKCSRLSIQEAERSAGYSRRLEKADTAAKADLSKAEWDDLTALQKIQDQERECAIAINQAGRDNAYEKYFGRKPTDAEVHDLAKWVAGPNYLGKRFYELMSEEKFEQDQMGAINFLKRAATATAPSISLGDSARQRRVVTWINLVSHPNPSREFIGQLVRRLESEWGKAQRGDLINDWLWETPTFLAKVRHQPVSATGPFVSLTIDAK
jgi:hypothetical protein